jgi:hypothetical protein
LGIVEEEERRRREGKFGNVYNNVIPNFGINI